MASYRSAPACGRKNATRPPDGAGGLSRSRVLLQPANPVAATTTAVVAAAAANQGRARSRIRIGGPITLTQYVNWDTSVRMLAAMAARSLTDRPMAATPSLVAADAPATPATVVAISPELVAASV